MRWAFQHICWFYVGCIKNLAPIFSVYLWSYWLSCCSYYLKWFLIDSTKPANLRPMQLKYLKNLKRNHTLYCLRLRQSLIKRVMLLVESSKWRDLVLFVFNHFFIKAYAICVLQIYERWNYNGGSFYCHKRLPKP